MIATSPFFITLRYVSARGLRTLCAGHRAPLLLLAVVCGQPPVEFRQEPPGRRIVGDRPLRIPVRRDRGVLLEQVAVLLLLVEDLLGVYGHSGSFVRTSHG